MFIRNKIRSSKKELQPTMILWDTSFTHDNPLFRVSFMPGETKSNMANLFLNVEIPTDYENYDIVELTSSENKVVYISSWDEFLKTATPDQVKEIKSFIRWFQKNNRLG